jgi:hypothetical protein
LKQLFEFYLRLFIPEINYNHTVISIGGIGIGGYTFIVGKVSIPWSEQTLGY